MIRHEEAPSKPSSYSVSQKSILGRIEGAWRLNWHGLTTQLLSHTRTGAIVAEAIQDVNSSPVKAILFDLDNTLYDREAAFRSVAEAFYREHLSVSANAPLVDVVEKLVLWDEDGYGRSGRQRWFDEWPDIGRSPAELEQWYRSATERRYPRLQDQWVSVDSERARGPLGHHNQREA